MALKYYTTCIMFVLFTLASCSSLKLHFFISNNSSLRFIYLLPVLLHIVLTPKEMPTSQEFSFHVSSHVYSCVESQAILAGGIYSGTVLYF